MPPRQSGRNNRGTLGVMMMISVVLSRRVSTRILAQAFTTQTSNRLALRSLIHGNQYLGQQHPFSTVNRIAQVDEDLDAALDDLLGDAIKDGKNKAEKRSTKEAKPISPKLIETVSCRRYR